MNKISSKCSSNIALVKYWGKMAHQIPMNPSISITLNNAFTETSISWERLNDGDETMVSLLFEGQQNQAFEKRLSLFINHITEYIPSLKGLKLHIESANSFPHSSGIASSASAMGALALGLIELEKQINGQIYGFSDEQQKASFIARLGSGSAARSIYNGYTLWGKTELISDSSNEYAIPINNLVHPNFTNYCDAILLVSDSIKKVSSSVGHGLMTNHPYADARFRSAKNNIADLLTILKTGEQFDFAHLVESEALALHAMMMTSRPSFILMEPNTLELINLIQDFRKQTGLPVCFTLDAGANLHLLYPKTNKPIILGLINDDLKKFCVNERWIDDEIKW